MPQRTQAAASDRFRRRWWNAAAGLAIAVGSLRVVATYSVFSPTTDEPVHVASGMAWLTRIGGYGTEHPPLARAAAAAPLLLSGVRPRGERNATALLPKGLAPLAREGRALLFEAGRIERNLALARLGILPFFVLASALVWSWSCRLFGAGAGLASVVLFTSLPAVLAHAGLATTDMAVTATLFGAVYALSLWLERPTPLRGAVLGVAIALAVLSKLSTLLFFPAVGIALVLVSSFSRQRPPTTAPRWFTSAALAIVTVCVVVWAGYRFSTSPARSPELQPQALVRSLHVEGILSRHPGLREALFAVLRAPVPGELVDGVVAVVAHVRRGHAAYLFGEYREGGWWYFFPVVLAFKTPLGFLALAGVGLVAMLRRRRELGWKAFAPAASALAILLVVLPSRINIGVRHVLPIYPFLSVVAGYGAARLFSAPRRAGAFALGLILMLWHLGSSAVAHPDYIPYFNELAMGRPERVTLDSDLDWGQDTKRLAARLRQLGASRIAAGGLDFEYLEKTAGVRACTLDPYDPVTGWVAVPEHFLKVKGEKVRREMARSDTGFAWLEAHPFERVGKSIRLYRIAP